MSELGGQCKHQNSPACTEKMSDSGSSNCWSWALQKKKTRHMGTVTLYLCNQYHHSEDLAYWRGPDDVLCPPQFSDSVTGRPCSKSMHRICKLFANAALYSLGPYNNQNCNNAHSAALYGSCFHFACCHAVLTNLRLARCIQKGHTFPSEPSDQTCCWRMVFVFNHFLPTMRERHTSCSIWKICKDLSKLLHTAQWCLCVRNYLIKRCKRW